MAEQEQAAESAPATEAADDYIREALKAARLEPGDPGYEETAKGIRELFRSMLASDDKKEQVRREVVDDLIAEIDRDLTAQVNEVLHHPQFQKLESTWRGVKMMVDNFDFKENIQLNILNVSKEDLLQDFRDSPERLKSGLYRKIYSAHYDQFGGDPYGMIVADYDFDQTEQDMELLANCAAVGAMAHAPVLTNASAKFFGCDSYTELEHAEGLDSTFSGPAYAKWQSFRDEPDSRYIGLCGPRFLQRSPYEGKSGRDGLFNFKEDVVGKHDNYLWGGSAFALATRVADSFAKTRWAPNITGPKAGGAVKNLPVHTYEAHGEEVMKVPTEVVLTDERWFELYKLGFIPLVYRKGSDNAAFFKAASAQRPKTFPNTPEGLQAQTNYELGTQLPYLFIITRLAHYLKVLQREELETWKEREDVQRGLNEWISQYVAEMDNPSEETRRRKPLREARITVDEIPGQVGWYECSLEVRPFFKFGGANFTLSLVGKLAKKS